MDDLPSELRQIAQEDQWRAAQEEKAQRKVRSDDKFYLRLIKVGLLQSVLLLPILVWSNAFAGSSKTLILGEVAAAMIIVGCMLPGAYGEVSSRPTIASNHWLLADLRRYFLRFVSVLCLQLFMVIVILNFWLITEDHVLWLSLPLVMVFTTLGGYVIRLSWNLLRRLWSEAKQAWRDAR